MLLLSIWLISCTFETTRVAKIYVSLAWSSRRNRFWITDDWCWQSDWWKPCCNPSTASCPWLFACVGEGKHLLLVILLALLQPSSCKACIPRYWCLLYRRTCPCFWWLRCIFKSACIVEISRRYFWCYPTRWCPISIWLIKRSLRAPPCMLLQMAFNSFGINLISFFSRTDERSCSTLMYWCTVF